MSKDKLIQALGDEHKEFVTNLSDAQVEAILSLEKTVEKVVEKTVEVPVANKAETLDDVLALAPEAVRAQIQDALIVNNDHRNSLIAKVTANPQNAFSAEELAVMPTSMLTKLSALAIVANAAPQNQPRFAGSAPVSGEPVKVQGFLPPSSFEVKG